MGIVAVHRPLQPVKEEKEKKVDPLDQILKGLQIASNVFGIKTSIEQGRLNSLKAEQMQKQLDAPAPVGLAAGEIESAEFYKNFHEIPETSLKEFQKTYGTGLPVLEFQVNTAGGSRKAKGVDKELFKQIMSDRTKAKAAAAKGSGTGTNTKGGKIIGSADASEIGQMMGAEKLIKDLYADYKKNASAYLSGISSLMPWSVDADKYAASRKQKAQMIGGIMEGGKLTEEDFNRYFAMMPSPWDTDAQAKNKVSELRQTLKINLEGKIEGLKASGYDTSGLEVKKIPFLPLKPGEEGHEEFEERYLNK